MLFQVLPSLWNFSNHLRPRESLLLCIPLSIWTPLALLFSLLHQFFSTYWCSLSNWVISFSRVGVLTWGCLSSEHVRISVTFPPHRGWESWNQVRDGLGEADLPTEFGLSEASGLASALCPRDMGRSKVVHATVRVMESCLLCGVGQYEWQFWQQDYTVAPVKQCLRDGKPVREGSGKI